MQRFLVTFLLATLLAVSPASAKTLTKVAAVVNNDIISNFQLDKAILKALDREAKGNQLTSKEFDQLRVRVLEKLINDTLVDQRIKQLGLAVPEPELNAAIEDVRLRNNLTMEDLEKALEAQGLSYEGYRQQLKTEILRFKLLGREINYKVQVTNNEIRQYFREHIDEYRAQPKVRVRNLSYELPAGASAEQIAEIRKQALASRDLLLTGEDFEKVLADQGNAVFGGDMGYLVEDDLADILKEALTGLEAGQVSEPVEMNGQLHLFLVMERNPGDINLYDRVKGEIEDILLKQKTDRRFEEWAQELRDQSQIDIRI